ncbi:Putative origin recognition complex, subunit 6 [Septoria linicola]|uniref:Origin recognition complex, subunit 6 n=1 Tax=Septoria linicola TaxID=215465 RepID=A0A9Q9AQH5_9PEZI|nr:putative origin recognition complex, subunit 6 [Septoria linicola]USW51233.1 Putative origin recognition complex, subunit 6 [Septoria linicola]
MPSATEIALSTLLPTVSFLPPDLIALANSLLAQSRSKAASLKPEEEIGRTYACAHIAAERLKKRLDLELDKPKPPCPPKVYKKLYGYLDGALSAPIPRTPSKREKVVEESTPGGSTAKKTTASAGKLKTPTTATKRARDDAVVVGESDGKRDGLPDFLLPMVRDLCKATRTHTAVPHVVVGAGAAAKEIASRLSKRALDVEPSAKRRRTRTPQSAKAKEVAAENVGDAVAVEKWPALVVALFLYTVARLRGSEVEREEIGNVRETACEAVEQYVILNAASLPKQLDSVTATSLKKPVDFYMLEAEDCGWLNMDWYRNVPENVKDEPLEEDDEVDVAMEDEGPITPRKRPGKTPLRRKEKHGGKAALAADGLEEDDLGAAGLLAGLGTMFQPAIDWLSDERRADFVKWKKSILKECVTVEANA